MFKKSVFHSFHSKTFIAAGFFLLLILPYKAYSQQREKISTNKGWEFIKSDLLIPGDIDWAGRGIEETDLPHTWNDNDVLDEIPGYYRGVGWYRKQVDLLEGWEKRRVFLEFEAANQLAEVFVNGDRVGTHAGGYSGFRFDITEFLKPGDTHFDLSVRVDNSFNENIPPLSADFTFFGGIYRDAWIIYAPLVHFSLEHYGGPGVYWQTPVVNRERAEVKVFGYITNSTGRKLKYKVDHTLFDNHGLPIERESFMQSFKGGNNMALETVSFVVDDPLLWSPESPVTYTLQSRLVDIKTGEVIDEVKNPLGFRWFEFTADSGFFLNGDHLKIYGISRHQDHPGRGNALDESEHLLDIRNIKGMGANFLRIAHYPQDQSVISACDTAGLLASVEIPVVNYITESDSFTENCLQMMKEMIWQNYNHPGLIMWTYMNEVLLRPPFLDDPDRLKLYFSNVEALAQKLEQTARQLDPYRVTMIPNHGAMSRYNEVGLTKIPMVVGWNLYQGWYGTGFNGFGKFLDNHHALLPGKPLLVTEYGAGHDPRLVTSDPERFDFADSYAMMYHKAYVEALEKREFVSGGMIWILNDFSSEGRGDAVPHINNKGLCDIDRHPKETYWYYKAIWNKEPFVRIWTPYPGLLFSCDDHPTRDQKTVETVKIYTNSDEVELVLNGRDMGLYRSDSGLVRAGLPLKPGKNTLQALIPGSAVRDTLSFRYIDHPGSIGVTPNDINLHISCGDHRYFLDPEEKELWIPDQPYTPGSWGYIGGKPFSVKTRHGVKPSSDQQIFDTPLDPVFQTQRVAPDEYRFDIPPGSYEVTLLFAELSASSELITTVYNLGDDAVDQGLERREFEIIINGEEVIDSMNIFESAGSFRACEKSVKINIADNSGLQIRFVKELGDPIVSGIVIHAMQTR